MRRCAPTCCLTPPPTPPTCAWRRVTLACCGTAAAAGLLNRDVRAVRPSASMAATGLPTVLFTLLAHSFPFAATCSPACSWLCGTPPRPFCSRPGSSSWHAGGTRPREGRGSRWQAAWVAIAAKQSGHSSPRRANKKHRQRQQPLRSPLAVVNGSPGTEQKGSAASTPPQHHTLSRQHPSPTLPNPLLIPQLRTLQPPSRTSLACSWGVRGRSVE